MLAKTDPAHTQQSLRGFTIVELLIVIVVIGILAAIVVVAYTGITTQAKNATLQSDLRNNHMLLATENATNGSYPATAAAANGGTGLKSSPGTTLNYVYGYRGQSNAYCLSAVTSGATSYRTSSINGAQEGLCDQATVIKGAPGPSCGANCYYLTIVTTNFTAGSYTVYCVFGSTTTTPTVRSLPANGTHQLTCYNSTLGVNSYAVINGWGQTTAITW